MSDDFEILVQAAKCIRDEGEGPAWSAQHALVIADAIDISIARIAALEEALEFYADPDTYCAISFWSDPPCGEFMEDFSEDHGYFDYDRPMPGARARAVLMREHKVD